MTSIEDRVYPCFGEPGWVGPPLGSWDNRPGSLVYGSRLFYVDSQLILVTVRPEADGQVVVTRRMDGKVEDWRGQPSQIEVPAGATDQATWLWMEIRRRAFRVLEKQQLGQWLPESKPKPDPVVSEIHRLWSYSRAVWCDYAFKDAQAGADYAAASACWARVLEAVDDHRLTQAVAPLIEAAQLLRRYHNEAMYEQKALERIAV